MLYYVKELFQFLIFIYVYLLIIFLITVYVQQVYIQPKKLIFSCDGSQRVPARPTDVSPKRVVTYKKKVINLIPGPNVKINITIFLQPGIYEIYGYVLLWFNNLYYA